MVITDKRADILNPCVKDIAELIDGVQRYKLIVSEFMDRLPAEPIICIEPVLADPLFFHCIPQIVVFYHFPWNLKSHSVVLLIATISL